jgi:large subunit ribosomal protein L24e|tara:strand:- start:391 stop:636 length:246 start_codon:yes stop_codon:yes gene_type:complete
MADCSFCGKELPSGSGKMYIKKDGTVLYFCKMKCEKNMVKLGRNPRKKLWTAAGQIEKEKRLHQIDHEKKEKAEKKPEAKK